MKPGKGTPIIHPSVMMRRDVVLRVGGYNERMIAAQDTDLWLRISGLSKLQAIPDVLLLLRKHAGSVSVLHRETQLLSSVLARASYHARQGRLDNSVPWSEKAWSQLLAYATDVVEQTGLLRAQEARIAISQELARFSGYQKGVKLAQLLIFRPDLLRGLGFRRRWEKAVRRITAAAVCFSSEV
jgi:hypothetical protein